MLIFHFDSMAEQCETSPDAIMTVYRYHFEYIVCFVVLELTQQTNLK